MTAAERGEEAGGTPMQTADPARILQQHALDRLRLGLSASAARVLVIEDDAGLRGLASASGPFDAAWLQLESALERDPEALARDLARLLRPGARIVCVLAGARPSVRAWRHALAPFVAWRRSWALGVLVPSGAAWARLHPLALGLLAAAEQVLAGWPLLRALGERSVNEGLRR